MQPTRHAARRRATRRPGLLRPGLLRSGLLQYGLLQYGLVGLLAVPSLLGLTTLATDGLHLSAETAGPASVPALVPTPVPASDPASVPNPVPSSVPTPVPTPFATRASAGEHAVVGLGDSVPAGSGCDCSDYVTLLGHSLSRAQGSPVLTSNLASPGETSADLVAQLGAADTRSALADADVVVVTIGANDLEGVDPTTCQADAGENGDDTVAACYRAQLDTLARNLDRALTLVGQLAPTPGTRVLVTGYWNVFLDGTVGKSHGAAYVQLADSATRAVNARIADAAKAHGDTFVDLFTPFRGSDGTRDCTDLLAPDGDHPDADGHALIAGTLAAAL
ncbi:MAG: GDSL-type esterase/lipase family protein [Kineosporiaceae bacterium]